MIYIVYFKRDEILAERIGLKEIQHYAHLKNFLPLLEKRGTVVRVDNPVEQVNGVYQIADYMGQPCLYLSFSPPDQDYCEVFCPKIFVASIIKHRNTYLSGQQQSAPEEVLRAGIRQSLAGVSHCAEAMKTISDMANGEFMLACIPPPLWNSYEKLYNKDFPEKAASYPISTFGDIIDSGLPGLRPKPVSYRVPLRRRIQSVLTALQHNRRLLALEYLVQRKSVHYYPAALDLTGIVYTAVIRPSNPFKDWKRLIKDFCRVFRDTEDATLAIKMAGRVKEVTKKAAVLLLKWKPASCRVIIINEHLPQEQYENLVRATDYIINISTSREVGNSLLEFMSAGKPAISPGYTGLPLLSSENAFIVPARDDAKFSVSEQLAQSYATIKNSPERYRAMAESATESMKTHCSEAVIEPRFFAFLDQVEALLPLLLLFLLELKVTEFFCQIGC
ncbi:MAG: glycosyltransferase [Lewinellaceae bacterium]|nr:glycosyltransferase [Phaeodactylibacter sp.]MCB9037170.1 glycosyltransferase [Lewinellaceae bacterium]